MKQVKAMVRPSLLSGDLRKYRKAGGIIFSLCFFLFSCEKELGYRDKLFPDEVEVVIVTPPDPADGSLLFHENFRRWNREGYDNPPTGDCEADQMTTALVMYAPSRPRIAEYDGFSVAYTLKDFAVNPSCGAQGGNSTEDSEVSTGFVALQQTIFYECGQHDSDGLMQLSALPSVSKIRFSVSLGGKIEDVAGVSLWKKAGDGGTFTKVGDFKPSDPENGEVFTAEINEANVQLKFTPALTGRETPVNDGLIRAVRIHDLWVWSMGE